MEFRDLPSVDDLATDLGRLQPDVPRPLLVAAARSALERARHLIASDQVADLDAIAAEELASLAGARPRRVVNATGVLLHTNLGRATVAEPASAAAAEQAASYGNVEFDIGSGGRGGRGSYVRNLLVELTGAEAALAVNNGAGALVLSLAAIAGSGSVVVSRGELIEIGGSFRLPDLMASSGARLVEVGTTNKTKLADYEAALPDAAAVLKVHPSNYRIEGFTAEVDWPELAVAANEHGVVMVADLGSGLLDTRTPWLAGPPPAWLAGEPGVRQTVESGAGVVLFSGDKLLGGPQAGIAVGRRDLIGRMATHPLARALRLDGPTQASLAATLELYASGHGADIPFWRMATLPYAELEERHERVLAASGAPGKVVLGESVPGAGSAPGATIASPAIQIDGDADALWTQLVASPVPVVARRRDGALLIDLRTVSPDDDDAVAAALAGLA